MFEKITADNLSRILSPLKTRFSMDFKLTTDHDEIRAWVEEHGAFPAIKEKRAGRRGVLDVCFDEMDPDCQRISWDEFFDTFDSLNLTFRFECLNDTCSEFAFSILHQDEVESETEDELGRAMPEDVPIENVIPSAPPAVGPDSINNNMTYS